MSTEMIIRGDVESQLHQSRVNEPPGLFKKANRHVSIKFEDVKYTIKTKTDGCLGQKSSKSEEKLILKGITGAVFPGEMLAMLGPSGSGKTTLLTALGGRLGGHLEGNITYNDKPFTNVMKRNTGFVTQDDVLYPHLTVTETLVFTALLRLPNTFTKEEKTMHAEAVISQLGLTKCKNSIIGGPLLRGVSGGERKRVSIGQEMLINPSLLFLDEPTSGLDSTTAQRIVSTLSELAKGRRTVLMTIHQPSSRIFYMFHKVLLLSDGNPLYFGKGAGVMDYFFNIGYSPSVPMNPADYLLDLANGVVSDDSEDRVAVKQTLVSAYKSIGVCLQENQETHNDFHDGVEGVEEKKFNRWSTTWSQQFSVLLKRGIKERRHESFSGLKIGQVLVVSFLAGLLWWHSSVAHLQDQVGLLFFMSGFWGFFPLFEAIFTFPQERMMLTKERSSGMYRLSSYFMARIVGDLPMELVLPTIFVTIAYWMGGLKPTAANFLETLFVLLLSVMVAQGLGLALGALVMDLKSATTLGSVIMLTFLLAGGYYVQHVPGFISWTKYISLSHYTYKLLLGSQYETDETYPCAPNASCTVGSFPAVKMVGLDHKGISLGALAIMLVGYRLIAYIALMRIGKKRDKVEDITDSFGDASEPDYHPEEGSGGESQPTRTRSTGLLSRLFRRGRGLNEGLASRSSSSSLRVPARHSIDLHSQNPRQETQQTIPNMMGGGSSSREYACGKIASMFYENVIPFNVALSQSYHEAFNSVANYDDDEPLLPTHEEWPEELERELSAKDPEVNEQRRYSTSVIDTNFPENWSQAPMYQTAIEPLPEAYFDFNFNQINLEHGQPSNYSEFDTNKFDSV
ncbi:hypothetical protein GIB67_025032 [Kingdonia uniflora]|uniref:ABC transporter domain-containing protein n=1 Tax=Kingdonia uniflora TaxID=39325 RepID=A0A7J7N8E7_9MAGN|nr:hypothetical protein GIB67_025032 [Kingdonia uniflora]